MGKYRIKHIKADYLKDNNMYIQYFEDIDFIHFTVYGENATVFTNKKDVNKILKKLNHPENWEVCKYEKQQANR